MARDSTHGSPRTFNISRKQVIAGITTVVAAPIVSFLLALAYLTPASYEQRMRLMRKEVTEAQAEVAMMQAAYDSMRMERESIIKALNTEREQRAAAEAVTAIADNARATSAAKLQDLENELYELRNKVKLYDSFLRPDDQALPLQCFNLRVNYDQPNNRIMYSVTFLKTDNKDKRSMDIEVRFQVLSGVDVVGIDEALDSADRVRKTSLTQERQLSGVLSTNLRGEGMRILDVKAYGAGDTLVGHCWKAF
jgi:hypothetical protein